MHRTSAAHPVISETPVIPFPGTERQQETLGVVPTVNRVATIEPGIGCFRIVYRDEHGSPLLDWLCDYRVDDEHRQWLRKVQQAIGDGLRGLGRTAPRLRVL